MEYSTFKEFQTAVKDYIDYYNNKRIQEKTKWMSLFNTGNIHAFSLINVSRNLGTYQLGLGSFLLFNLYAVFCSPQDEAAHENERIKV